MPVRHEFSTSGSPGWSLRGDASAIDGGDRVLDDGRSVVLVVDYPVARPVSVALAVPGGGAWTAARFAEAVARTYRSLPGGGSGLVLRAAERGDDGRWRIFVDWPGEWGGFRGEVRVDGTAPARDVGPGRRDWEWEG